MLFVKALLEKCLLKYPSDFTEVLNKLGPYFDRLYLTLPMGDTSCVPEKSGILMVLSFCWIEAIPSCLPSERQRNVMMKLWRDQWFLTERVEMCCKPYHIQVLSVLV